MSDTDTILIPNQEIQAGIYVANTITSKQNTFVRLLNTTSTFHLISITSRKINQRQYSRAICIRIQQPTSPQENHSGFKRKEMATSS